MTPLTTKEEILLEICDYNRLNHFHELAMQKYSAKIAELKKDLQIVIDREKTGKRRNCVAALKGEGAV